ncbi:hypothetical protein GQ457_10G007360 [Hibiscus cannabinus]
MENPSGNTNPNFASTDGARSAMATGDILGNNGGRPPDNFIHMEDDLVLERSGSPVDENDQPACKKGRNCEVSSEFLMQSVSMHSAERGVVLESNSHSGGQEQGLSFRDTLLGGIGRIDSDALVEDLDVEVREEYVIIRREGDLPEIRFSDRVHAAIDEKLAKSVVIRLLGKHIGYRALWNRIMALWQPKGAINLIDLDNGYFLVRFAIEEDFNKVLTGGPWVIYGTYLTVQPWHRNFSTNEDYPSQIMVWVRLPNLPYRYYSKSLFRYIAATIGKVVRVDYNTSEGKRGRFARLAIMVDLGKPLISWIIIDGHRQDIEYEGLPTICFKCGKYGHAKEFCGAHEPQLAESETRPLQRDESELYGPWMQVVNRRRRSGGYMNPSGSFTRSRASGKASGSRFMVLADDVVGTGGEADAGRGGPTVSIQASPIHVEIREENREGEAQREMVAVSPRRRDAVESSEPMTDGNRLGRDIRASCTLGGTEQGDQTKVAAQGTVRGGKSSLNSKHTVVTVDESTNVKGIRNMTGQVLPSSIRGGSSLGSTKKGAGLPLGHKGSLKPRKKDTRGPSSSTLAASLAPLVAELESAGKGVIDRRGPGLNTEHPPGASDPGFRRSFKLLIRKQQPDMVAIMEPRISGAEADRFVRFMQFDFLYRVEAVGFSGGIWILWKNTVRFDVLAVSKQFVHGVCHFDQDASRCLVSFVYASPNSSKRSSLWPQLLALNPGPNVPWLVGGDLNVIRSSDKRQGVLLDALAEVSHLLKLGSDHRPILLNSSRFRGDRGVRPFRYLAAWATHPDFQNFVRSEWGEDVPIKENIANFQQSGRVWNVEVFGHIEHRKNRILARLHGIEKAMEVRFRPSLLCLELKLKRELDEVPEQEESLWFQKSRSDWIELGDRNTRFFHLSSMARRSANRIRMLRLPNGEWCDDSTILQEHTVAYFRELFTSNLPQQRLHSLGGEFYQFREEELWPLLGEDWPQAFAIFCWLLWKNRCCRVMGSECMPREELLARGRRMLEECSRTFRGSRHTVRRGLLMSWQRPPLEWVKVNVDAAVNVFDQRAVVGGVFRDSDGEWLFGFTQSIGSCSVLLAELWAIFEALCRAWAKGYRYVELESDCANALSIAQIPRACNVCADRLAALGRGQVEEVVEFEAPPAELLDLVVEEAAVSG